jgi:hypothetical protein
MGRSMFPYLETSKFALLDILGMSTIRNTPLLNTVLQAERDRSAICHLPETNCVIPPASYLFDLSLQRCLARTHTDADHQWCTSHSHG